ncbi:MAG: M48 metallopeptidase family protein, partial [Acidimicrobiales bacterium]
REMSSSAIQPPSRAAASRQGGSGSAKGRPAPTRGARLAYSIPVSIAPGTEATVEIRVSERRKRTSQAHLEPGRVVVVVPSRLSVASREDVATRLARRMLNQSGRRRVDSDRELESRAVELADLYLDGVRASSIRWVTNQTRRWGSCTVGTGSIRLSARLKVVPGWVLDSVIVHELAHLLEGSHSADFHALVSRYPRHAEAEAFLLGFEQGCTTASMALGPIPLESWAGGNTEVRPGSGDCCEDRDGSDVIGAPAQMRLG